MQKIIAFILLSTLLVSAVEVSDLDGIICTGCKDVFTPLWDLIKSGAAESVVKFTAKEVCIAFDLVKKMGYKCDTDTYCKEVCDGIIDVMGDEFLFIIANAYVDTQDICSAIDLCPKKPVIPEISSVPEIRSNITNFSGEKQWKNWANTSEIGTFLHMTDIHIDL